MYWVGPVAAASSSGMNVYFASPVPPGSTTPVPLTAVSPVRSGPSIVNLSFAGSPLRSTNWRSTLTSVKLAVVLPLSSSNPAAKTLRVVTADWSIWMRTVAQMLFPEPDAWAPWTSSGSAGGGLQRVPPPPGGRVLVAAPPGLPGPLTAAGPAPRSFEIAPRIPSAMQARV